MICDLHIEYTTFGRVNLAHINGQSLIRLRYNIEHAMTPTACLVVEEEILSVLDRY